MTRFQSQQQKSAQPGQVVFPYAMNAPQNGRPMGQHQMQQNHGIVVPNQEPLTSQMLAAAPPQVCRGPLSILHT